MLYVASKNDSLKVHEQIDLDKKVTACISVVLALRNLNIVFYKKLNDLFPR